MLLLPSSFSKEEINNTLINSLSKIPARSLDGSIQNIQVDSQLHDCQSSVILYLSPTSKSDESRHMPAIHFTAHKNVGPNAATENAENFKHLVSHAQEAKFSLDWSCCHLRYKKDTRC